MNIAEATGVEWLSDPTLPLSLTDCHGEGHISWFGFVKNTSLPNQESPHIQWHIVTDLAHVDIYPTYAAPLHHGEILNLQQISDFDQLDAESF